MGQRRKFSAEYKREAMARLQAHELYEIATRHMKMEGGVIWSCGVLTRPKAEELGATVVVAKKKFEGSASSSRQNSGLVAR
jgi:hypothetical protein